MPHRLLIIEDDRDLARNLVDYLGLRGYVVDYAPDGFSAENLLKRENYDLIVLDLNLPGIDGISLCKRYRHEMYGRTPLVILTAQDDVDVKISALDIGADDYVVKPYSVVELMARLRTQLRRTRPATMGERLSYADIILDAGEHRVFRAGQSLHLGPTEFRLLSTLMEKPGRVWSREQLLDRVWGRDIYVDTRTIDVHVGRLRKALMVHGGDDPVRTVRGAGYALG